MTTTMLATASETSHATATIVDLDAIANAITPDLLQPYVAPQRPFSLGANATHYMRAAYVPRIEFDEAATARSRRESAAIDAMTHRAVAALAASIANALGARTIADIAWTRPETVADDGATWRDSVVVCTDALAQVADPTPLLALLARIQRDAAVLVISAPLREFTLTMDDVGPPARPDRAREWAFPELQALLDAAGLDAVFGGLIPATAAGPTGQTAVFVAVRGQRPV